MVTFIGSDMISRWSRARQVKAVMQLVVDELKVNREPLQTVCQKLRYDRHGMLMLQRYDMDLDRIPRDTLDYYMNIIGAMESLWPQVDALEVLKSSGVIASIDNKQLLLDILGCYNRMQNLGDKVDTYNGRKMSALDHLFATNRDFSISNTNSYVGWKTFMNDPMCAAFLGTMAYYFGYEDTFDNYLIELDRTVESVTKKYSLE